MRIAVTGSSGLIGSALVRSLLEDGHQVVRLVRRAPVVRPDGSTEVRWNPRLSQIDRGGLDGLDAAVNLAGAGIADRRWTAAHKRDIHDSRVLGTTTLAGALAGLARPPKVLVSGSAVGYYGQTGSAVIDESAPAGGDFLARVCVEWEQAAEPAAAAGIRVAYARTGLVVAAEGGAWQKLFPLFKLGLGGRLGNGRQYWSYISLRDEVAALRHIIDTAELSGPVNLTAPVPVTNAEVTAAMGEVLHRPTLFSVPEVALKAALGEMAVEVVGSHRVVPGRLLDSGFRFSHSTIEQAVRAAQ
ncbi:TIGR01777 family oxidoreductase [Streptacidiphilus sp. P02-A3a]|uniref:TIGR01777 family oxidoreductase n=1 Tax=Streptacidiphilus sp. P02-A3a TaxID=2704468 RepID=UPI0015FC2874|nr:TIGR01777 family oxidoreductase [Streptacidiphilus sp. P02-A3a]QMU68479.1 TIGR01777 family protein [Streptacidiphilus sp. P02-A3a]